MDIKNARGKTVADLASDLQKVTKNWRYSSIPGQISIGGQGDEDIPREEHLSPLGSQIVQHPWPQP